MEVKVGRRVTEIHRDVGPWYAAKRFHLFENRLQDGRFKSGQIIKFQIDYRTIAASIS